MRNQDTRSDYIELVDQIKRIPIVDIFDRYVGGKLRQHGKKAVSACPWHGRDSSPSLTLYTDKGNWYCYGCQKGGTVIDMVMVSLGTDFKSAVAAIAKDFGLSSGAPNPEIRKKINTQQKRRSADLAFAADYDRVYLALVKLRNIISLKLRTYEDFERNQKLVHTLPILEGIIDELVSAKEQAAKLRAWRLARKVFPWLKKMKS
jgi:DNA primase